MKNNLRCGMMDWGINFIDIDQAIMDSQRSRVGCLMELMEIVCSNAGYSRFIDEKMLVEWRTYFDICQLIFAELSIKIIKIQQNPNASPAQKLHQLILLLSQELEVEEFRAIDARQVLAFNLEHIHRLLEILYLYSKIYMESKKPTTVVKSETEEKQKEKPAFSSARDNRKSEEANDEESNQQQSHQQDESTHREEYSSQHQPYARPSYSKEEEYLIPDKRKKKKIKPQYSANAKRARSQSAQRKNLHEGIVNTIVGEKSSLIRASTRDNRKSRLEGIKMAKDQYKSYLKRYAKENNATFKRNQHLKQKGKAKPLSQELPQKDFQAIDNFFQSFACKFRDKKAAYLQRIQKLVHQQELDRFLHQNRLERELKQAMNSHLEEEISSQTHQHRVRSALLREKSTALDQNTVSMTKEARRKNSIQRRELKEAKREELKVIENALRQENEKVLMSLEEGGRLQQIIMQMYKRF